MKERYCPEERRRSYCEIRMFWILIAPSEKQSRRLLAELVGCFQRDFKSVRVLSNRPPRI